MMATQVSTRVLQVLLVLLLAFLLLASAAVLVALSVSAALPDGLFDLYASRAPGLADAAPFGTAGGRRATAAALLTAAPEAAVVILLQRMLASVRRGSPLVAANVARLRWMAAAYALSLACRPILPLLASPEAATWLNGSGWSFNISDLGPALVALVLAQVFREGIQLREDVDATI